jgi:riboflavin kinase / FMN adenylyltransferase
MRVFNSLSETQNLGPGAAAAVGNFDGVHRGHQRVLAEAVEWAKKRGGRAAAITFRNHPREVLDPSAPPPVFIQTLDDRLDAIARTGVDACLALTFDAGLMGTAAQAFLEQIVRGRLGATALVMGARATFGRGGEGTAETAPAIGARAGVDVRIVPPLVEGGEAISSTAIRAALAAGDAARAALFLGRPFRLSGTVTGGAGRGRWIGFPTANIHPPARILCPARGVYATRAETGGRKYPAVTNIGVRPTFEAADTLHIETHLMDIEMDLAGKPIAIEFIARLRAEKKFASVEELKAQIGLDVKAAKALLAPS